MRRFSNHFGMGVIGLVALCAVGVIAAAPAKDQAVPTTTQPPVAPNTKTEIAPHRAIYAMELGTAKSGSNVNGVSGRMLFEWRDVCDGWAIQQHMQMRFSHEDGDDQNIVSDELTWEAKDGKRYTFNIRRMSDGEETENYRGKATQNADGSVTAVYTKPEAKTEHYAKGTLFPTAHTSLILQHAAQNDSFFSQAVFDGADEQGSSDISAFILAPRAEAAKEKEKNKDNPLLSTPAWPVHMAFFKADSEGGMPDYEMDMTLHANGIAQGMKIDYGDFTVVGKLLEVQALPAQNCP